MRTILLSVSIIALHLASPFYLYAQEEIWPERIWQRCLDLRKNGQLDSVEKKVCFFNDYFHLYDTAIKFYTHLDTLNYSDGFFAVGHVILDPSTSFEGRKIGFWTSHYPIGIIYSTAAFEVGAYSECQGGGPTAVGYNFKAGNWSYWYENGQLMAIGVYKPGKKSRITECASDTLYSSSAHSSLKCYDKLGRATFEKNAFISAINHGHKKGWF